MDRQTLYIGILMIALLAAAYFWFGNSLFVSPPEESGIQTEYAGTLSRIERLRQIRFDTDILQNKKFERLEKPVIPPLPDVKPGGRNPFLPI